MPWYENKNFGKTTLAEDLTTDETPVDVTSAASFPASGSFLCVIWHSTFHSPQDDSAAEVVEVTSVATNTFTCVRAQEGTSGHAWSSGDNIAHVLTAGKVDQIENNMGLQNLITNSGFGVWSNSTLENVGSNLITGTDSDFSGAGNWLLNGATVTSGVVRMNAWSSSLQLSKSGLTIGKLYKFSITCAVYTSGTCKLEIFGGGGAAYQAGPTFTPAGSTTYTFVFEAAETSHYVGLTYTTALTADFDNALLYEVTPGCVAADVKGPDGWWKNSGCSVWREHSGTNTKAGSFYALKMTGAAEVSAERLFWSSSGGGIEKTFVAKFAGRTVTFGCWVLCSSASKARIAFYDSVNSYTYSTYHSGGGTYEWLEVSLAVPSNTTEFDPVLFSGTSTTAYFSQPMLVFGSYIGAGNYFPINGEVIDCEVTIQYACASTVATLNIEAISNGKIPKAARAAHMTISGSNTAAGKYFYPASAAGNFGLILRSQVANIVCQDSGYQPFSIGTGDLNIDVSDANWSGVCLVFNAIVLN
jgi:hypothetical protein